MAEAPVWQRLWDWLVGFLPEPVASLPQWLLMLIAAAVVLIALLVVLGILGFVFRTLFGRRNKTAKQGSNLEEKLGAYPPLKASTGDRRLQVEGVPVRLRLVVVAAAGKESDVDQDEVGKMLEKILPGLGGIYEQDKPRLRVWPVQLSYEGFANHFHRNMIVPEPEGSQTPWVLVAGRAKLGKQQVMVGLALQALKPTTIGRLTLDSHEWETRLRVRVRD